MTRPSHASLIAEARSLDVHDLATQHAAIVVKHLIKALEAQPAEHGEDVANRVKAIVRECIPLHWLAHTQEAIVQAVINDMVHAVLAEVSPVDDHRQAAVLGWAIGAFGETARNVDERAARLAEEAIEAAQAVGVPREIVARLVDHVYSRPPGEIGREIGGVMLTVEGLAQVVGLSAEQEARREFDRVRAIPNDKFAERHAVKVRAGVADLSPPKQEKAG